MCAEHKNRKDIDNSMNKLRMQNNGENRLTKGLHVLFFSLSFLIPVFVMLGICHANGMYPFGQKSWLIYDMDNQYVSYFSYFKRAVKENGFFYTFSKTMGGDMLGFAAYYLMSPFNFLFLLVPTKGIPDMAAWISLVKLGLCGLSFYALSCYTFSDCEDRKFSGLIFSTAYAMSSYNLFYLSNIMWFDAVYMLPLVVLGIKKIVDKNSPFLYIITLSYTLLTNYYIGYMICIFAVLYYLYYVLCSHKGNIKMKVRQTALFCAASLLAGGMAMWLLLPTKYSLDGVKAPFRLSALTADKNFYWDDVFVKLLPGSSEDLMKGMPNLYCGVLVLFFAGVFFLNRTIALKKKIGLTVLFTLFYFSFYINGINLIWHGFNTPLGFPYRYSFLFIFLLVCTAQYGFLQNHIMSNKNRFTAAVLSLLAIASISFVMWKKQFSFMENKNYRISLLFVASSAIVLFLNRKKLQYVAFLLGLFFITAELYLNGSGVYKEFDAMPKSFYDLYTDLAEEDVRLLSAVDDNFYRMEKNFYRTMNDPMLFGYAGLSHYSSTEEIAIKQFMALMGFRNNGNWSFYNRGSTLAAESFLGVKYLLSRTKLSSPYVFVNRIDGTFLYKNPYAFSMAFLTDGSMEAFAADADSVFVFQNNLFETLWWEGGDIFTAQTDVLVSLHNLYALDDAGNYLKADEGAEGYIEYSFTLMNDNPLYMYLNTENMQPARIYIDAADAGAYFEIRQYDILCISDYTSADIGDTVTVRVVPGSSSINITDALFCYEDTAVLQAYHDYQAAGAVELKRLSDSHITGSFDNRENRNTILFSIPFSKNWLVYIDGKRQGTMQGAGIFLCVSNVPEGTHTIELKYVPKGFSAGLCISILCLAGTLAWLVYRTKRKHDIVLKRRLLIGAPVATGIVLLYLTVCFLVDDIRENGQKNSYKAQENTEQKTLFFGSMEQDGNLADEAEPIEWLVLDVQDGKALIVSKYALACLPYSSGEITVTWENSYLREWLNSDFYEMAFTKEEKEKILAVQLDNGETSTVYMDAGENTCDRVFILDSLDIQNYFGVNAYVEKNKFYSENAICEASAAAALNANSYSLSQDEYVAFYRNYGYSEQVVGSHGCPYWLRGPGLYTTGNARLVGSNGNVFDIGCFVTETNFVRPAMWIVYEK